MAEKRIRSNSANQYYIETIGKVGGTTESSKEKKESTRSEIASRYINGFLLIVFGAMLYSLYRQYSPNDTKDMLITISGILSGPLGFIIGYYFKTEEEDK